MFILFILFIAVGQSDSRSTLTTALPGSLSAQGSHHCERIASNSRDWTILCLHLFHECVHHMELLVVPLGHPTLEAVGSGLLPHF